MARNFPDDNSLIVTFYELVVTKVDPPRTEDRVRITSPISTTMEYHAKANQPSHFDDDEGRQVTYAERFADQYAAYLSGKSKSREEKSADLRRQLAALEGTKDKVSDSERKAAIEKARAEADKSGGPDFEAMTDDHLRDWIEDQTGKPVPGNVTKRETLERMAVEVAEG